MATTTNYAWETPDDTDLVKDGAAAIRTLGSSIDTTTKALNPSTTLGDIEYRSSTANTNTRLGIGTTGQVLTVAGGVPTWAASAGAGSRVVVAQASFTAASSVTVDNCFTSSYRNYQIVCNYTTSGGGGVRFRMRASGSSVSTATYNFQLFDSKSTTNTGDRAVADTSYVMGFGTGGSFNSSFNAMIYNPQIATPTTFFSQCAQHDGALSAPIVALSAGNQTGATAFDGFEFINSGTMTGNYTVYGLGIAL